MGTEPDVFVLTIDSLRYSSFHRYIEQLGSSTGGVNFTNAVATAPQTASAMPGLAAGVYHDESPVRGIPASGHPRPLAEVLAENGYSCGLWTDNFLFGSEYNYDRGFSVGNLGRPSRKKRIANMVRGGSLSPVFKLLEAGYFKIYQPLFSTRAGSGTFYEPAGSLNEKALHWLRSSEKGARLCWLHYMDTHHPYQAPEEFLLERTFNTNRSRSQLGHFTRDTVKTNGQGVSPANVEDTVTAYEACCEHIGEELLSFVGLLLDEGHFDPTQDVLVVTADHGECLSPEYGMMGHLPAAFWEQIVHVPLLIARPDWTSATFEEQVSLIDLMPTILDAVNIPAPGSISGRPCATPDELSREHAFGLSQPYSGDGKQRTYRSVRSADGWKLFGADRPDGDETLMTRYDSTTDGETLVHVTSGDSPPTDTAEVNRWTNLRGLLDSFGPPVEYGEPVGDESEQLESHLEDLGYM